MYFESAIIRKKYFGGIKLPEYFVSFLIFGIGNLKRLERWLVKKRINYQQVQIIIIGNYFYYYNLFYLCVHTKRKK